MTQKEQAVLADLLTNCAGIDQKSGCNKCRFDGTKDCCVKMMIFVAKALMKNKIP